MLARGARQETILWGPAVDNWAKCEWLASSFVLIHCRLTAPVQRLQGQPLLSGFKSQLCCLTSPQKCSGNTQRGLSHWVVVLSCGRVQWGHVPTYNFNLWTTICSIKGHILNTLCFFFVQMSPRSCGLKSHFSFSEPSQLAKLGL